MVNITRKLSYHHLFETDRETQRERDSVNFQISRLVTCYSSGLFTKNYLLGWFFWFFRLFMRNFSVFIQIIYTFLAVLTATSPLYWDLYLLSRVKLRKSKFLVKSISKFWRWTIGYVIAIFLYCLLSHTHQVCITQRNFFVGKYCENEIIWKLYGQLSSCEIILFSQL